MSSSTASRVQKHRSNLREQGLRPIQVWVRDTHAPGFADECRQQSVLAKNSEHEQEINKWIENSADLGGWVN